MQAINYLKLIDYLFKYSDLNIHLTKLNKKYNLGMENKELFDIFDIIKMNYSVSNKIEKTPCLLRMNDTFYIILEEDLLSFKTYNVYTKKYEIIEKSKLKKQEYINIGKLNENSICFLNRRDFLKEKYYFILEHIIVILFNLFSSFLIGILINIISFLTYMILDFYKIYTSYDGIRQNLFLGFVSLVILFLLYNISERYCLNRFFRNQKFSAEKKSYVYIINFISTTLILLLFIGNYNLNIVKLIMVQVIGAAFLVKGLSNVILKNKSFKIDFINSLYIIFSITLFSYLILLQLFNNSLGYTILSIPIFPYIFIIKKMCLFPKYYQEINKYNTKFKDYYIDRLNTNNNLPLVELYGNEDIVISKNQTNYVIKNNQINMLIGSSKVGKTLMANILTGKDVFHKTGLNIFIDENIPISYYSKKDLNKKVKCVSNSKLDIKDDAYNYISDNHKIYSEDLKKIFYQLHLENILNTKKVNYFTDTEKFLIEFCKIILDNPYIIIFDNILSRFSYNIVQDVINVCSANEITVIILEQKDITDIKVNKKIFLQ